MTMIRWDEVAGYRDESGLPWATYRVGELVVIASEGDGWAHVSASMADRCPTWEEMCLVKRLFFGPDAIVVQYHPPESEYVNCHPYALHMWCPLTAMMPLPPSWMVGPR